MRVVVGWRRGFAIPACAGLMAMLVPVVPAQADEPAVGSPAADGAARISSQIAGWIGDLGSAQFARREAASRSLVTAGQPALEPLLQAARNGDLEISSRAIEIFREMLSGEDAELAGAAERLLERIAEEDFQPAGSLAEAILDFHSVGLAEAARGQLEELGAVIGGNLEFEPDGLEVEVGPAWRGGSDDLRQLTRLRGLVAVRVRGVPLDDKAVAILGRLKTLRRLELFGTDLSAEAEKLLAERLPAPGVIDIRKGGKLGVSPLRMAGPCAVKPVPGAAAQRAGVEAGDVVVALGGEPVADFDGLTARVATHRPGERMVLDVMRESADGTPERLRLEVVLDAW